MTEAMRLLSHVAVGREVRREVRGFLASVAGRDAPVPTVTPGEDQGDVDLYWKTGPMSLEIGISATGPHYLWARDETGEIHCIEDSREAIVPLARRLILRMASRARQYNPRWRDQYMGND